MPCFRHALTSRSRLLFDGAMGTMLQARGLKPGENPEVFCLANPETLRGIHAELAELNEQATELAARIAGNFEELVG